MTKFIEVEDSGFVWEIPLEVIAADRAKYYAERDKDTTYQDEFYYVMDDECEGIDWFENNMNWEDVAKEAKLVVTPGPLAEPDMCTAEKRLVKR